MTIRRRRLLARQRQAQPVQQPVAQPAAQSMPVPTIRPMQAPSMGMPANAPPIGLMGSERAFKYGLSGALAGLSEGIGQGVSALNPYSQSGQQGQNLQAALAGLQGQEAFNQALMDSPATQYLMERMERGTRRDAAALGGLGGGNVRLELERRRAGIAAQDLQNQYERAQGLAQQGLQAGSQLGNLGLQGGMFAGQAALGTGQNLAAGRTRAAEQIAGQVGGTTSALAQLLNQQGSGISDITGQAGGNLANLLSGAGQAQGQSQQQLAAMLANLATQQGAQVAGLPGIPGVQQSGGILGDLGTLASGAASAYKEFK